MSKKKDELTKQKKNKKEGKKCSKKSKKECSTWVETAYHLSSVVRVGNSLFRGYQPATYFKMAKDSVITPVLANYSNQTGKVLGHLAAEVVECVISPPMYGINKVTALLTSGVGFFVKQSLDIQNPELRAAVDLLCKETAHQSTQRLMSSRNFFRALNTDQMKQQKGSQVIFRSKL